MILAGTTLAVDSNRIVKSDQSMDLKAGEAHYAVLGNICGGRIIVNGAALGGPWAPLNRINV